ncbi:MAG TPA: TIM-barrel domain-containing protein, partial [Thermoanaerobaculia bacterium]|nr:TIM-barrel domain-containing protein [Thermoanaerobaculia bacterium]
MIALLTLLLSAITASSSPKLDLDPSAGTMLLLIGGTSTPIAGLWLDEVFQDGFESVGPGRLRNDSLDLTIESVAPSSVAVTWSPRHKGLHEFRLRMKSDDETEYYGTGERFQALNQRGYVLPLRVDDRYGNKGVGSHKPVPFFISSKGFGVWVDSFAPGTFDLSGSERFNTDLRFRDRSLRVVFIGGGSVAGVLENWTALTGRSPVPPPWSFGLWKSRDVHRNREEVLEDVEKLRRFGIPASVLVLDSPWETGYNDFEINREQFTDPEARPHLVRDAGGEVALSEWWKGVGGLVDFTDPAAKEWWFSQLRKTKRYGARAFKCDDGEGNFVPEAVFHDGTPADQMKNRYAGLYNAAMQEYVERELGGDGVLIVRSGYTGVQKYPFAWAGDNRADLSFSDGLPSVIVAAQNAA